MIPFIVIRASAKSKPERSHVSPHGSLCALLLRTIFKTINCIFEFIKLKITIIRIFFIYHFGQSSCLLRKVQDTYLGRRCPFVGMYFTEPRLSFFLSFFNVCLNFYRWYCLKKKRKKKSLRFKLRTQFEILVIFMIRNPYNQSWYFYISSICTFKLPLFLFLFWYFLFLFSIESY